MLAGLFRYIECNTNSTRAGHRGESSLKFEFRVPPWSLNIKNQKVNFYTKFPGFQRFINKANEPGYYSNFHNLDISILGRGFPIIFL